MLRPVRRQGFPNLLSDTTGAAAKSILEAIIGLVVLVVGIYLAFFVLSLVLRIAILVAVVVIVLFLFGHAVKGVKKL